MQITVLEDDIALQRAILKALELDNHDVAAFGDADALLENLDEATELYLLDIHVEGMSGLELLEMLQRSNPNVKVIMMSVSTDLKTIDKAYSLGSIDYIKKPFHLNELLHKVALIEKRKGGFVSGLSVKEGVQLTKTERRFLALLYEKKPYILTYDEIESELYRDKGMSMDALRAFVRRVRAKLAEDVIENVSKEGYRYTK